jgi:hypothetical protein
MYLAISLRFCVHAAKIRFSFVTSKKLTKKVFVSGGGWEEKQKSATPGVDIALSLNIV